MTVLNEPRPSTAGALRRLPDRARVRGGFTITELLVVIALIVLLVSLLLGALAQVQKKTRETTTTTTMTSFSDACAAFQQEHGFYPGIVPEATLISDAGSGPPKISGTENALLHLLGGYVREEDVGATEFNMDYQAADGWQDIDFTDPDGQPYRIKVNLNRIGDGPVINRKPYAPYFQPSEKELRIAPGQVGAAIDLPDLVDAWGQPIVYVRRLRTVGPLNKNAPGDRAQFDPTSIKSYSNSNALGKLRQDQTQLSLFGAGATDPQMSLILSWLIAQPALTSVEGNFVVGQPRGAYLLLSAGPDGVYLSTRDGAGDTSNEVDASALFNGASIDAQYGPNIFDEYDDVTVFGGT